MRVWGRGTLEVVWTVYGVRGIDEDRSGSSRVKASASDVRHLVKASQRHVLVSSRISTQPPIPNNDQPPKSISSRQHRQPSLLACRGWHRHTCQSQGPSLARKPRRNTILS